MATDLDYQKHVATLARACGVAVKHTGNYIVAQFPNTFEVKFEHDAWRDALTYLVAYAKHEGVTVPQSTELLLLLLED